MESVQPFSEDDGKFMAALRHYREHNDRRSLEILQDYCRNAANLAYMKGREHAVRDIVQYAKDFVAR